MVNNSHELYKWWLFHMVSLPSCLESGLRDWSNWDLRSLDAEWPFYVQWPLTPRKMQWPRTVCTECVRDREGPEGNCENEARTAERMARLDSKKEKLKGHSRGTCLTSIMSSLHIIWWIKCNPWLMTGRCDTWSLQNVHQVVTRCRMTKRYKQAMQVKFDSSGSLWVTKKDAYNEWLWVMVQLVDDTGSYNVPHPGKLLYD